MMKNNMKKIFFIFLVTGLFSCGNKNNQDSQANIPDNTVHEQTEGTPSRKPFEGFEWVKTTGSGISLMTQKNDHIRLIADPALPGIVMVRDETPVPQRKIQIFDLENKEITDVLRYLETTDGWDKSQTCQFQEMESNRPDVRRYIMIPNGEYAKQISELMEKEPVPSTCNGWGVGNSGQRFFEIHKSNPDKALFIEIGQEMPLFDENSIRFTTKTSSGLSKDILYTLSGTLRIGHETRSFKPENSNDEFWVVDKTGKLYTLYDQVTKGTKNGEPIKATLKVEYNGKWKDGFAASYAGVYFVREIISLEK